MSDNNIDKNMHEKIREVTDYLGLTRATGEVKDTNTGIVLEFMIKNGKGSYKELLARLALRCRMQTRYIRENILEGLEYEHIVKVYMNNGEKFWEFVGAPSGNFTGGLAEKAPEYVKTKTDILKQIEDTKPKKRVKRDAEEVKENTEYINTLIREEKEKTKNESNTA